MGVLQNVFSSSFELNFSVRSLIKVYRFSQIVLLKSENYKHQDYYLVQRDY